jgi:hypothetical protein
VFQWCLYTSITDANKLQLKNVITSALWDQSVFTASNANRSAFAIKQFHAGDNAREALYASTPWKSSPFALEKTMTGKPVLTMTIFLV